MVLEVALLAGLAAGAGMAVALLGGPLRVWLIRLGVSDVPNARSSHRAVKPRGGGLAVLAVVLPAWAVLSGGAGDPWADLALIGVTAALAALSFADDALGLPAGLRFPGHIAAVAAGLWVVEPGLVCQGWLPAWLDLALAGIAWLWFTNLYNFMDGIDGITAVETLALGLGLGAVALFFGVPSQSAHASLPWLIGGAAAGVLAWNWAPAKMFLGDVGAIPLGYLLGGLLIAAAGHGAWAAALILPAYYLVDATLTLLRRAARGERVWRAHRQHAYQRAVQSGLSHAAVAGRIAVLNAVLIACAIWAMAGAVLPALVVAGALTLAVWGWFLRPTGTGEA